MNQPALFIEDMQEALREIVRALGGSKAVGPMLWPEKTPDSAAQLLANCLNANRPERLTPEQVFFLFAKARQIGFHAAKRWFDEATGYVPGEPMEPEDERAKLQRMTISAVQELALLTARLEKLNAGMR